jgi:hypothetical protein
MQDVTLLATLSQQNAELAEIAKMLAATRRELEDSARESRAAWAAEREAWAELLRGLRALRPRPEEDR